MWSKNFGQCQQCGTTKIKHASRGLCRRCYQKDIERKHRNVDRRRQRGIATQILTKEYLLEEYLHNKKSLSEIAKECGCSRMYVHKRMKQCKIQCRSLSAARKLATEGGKISFERQDEKGGITTITHSAQKLNEAFFRHWTPEMAWVLGVIYSDGSFEPGRIKDPTRKTNASIVSIVQKEPELLEKVLSLMDCNAKIFCRKNSYGFGDKNPARTIYQVSINANAICDDLIKIGLVPKKSLVIKFPDIPEYVVRHFIRGCWDGDGCIYKSVGSFRATYVSGSQNFIKDMANRLELAGLPKRTIYERQYSRNHIYYEFKFGGFKQCGLLYQYFYDGVGPKMYLERKHRMFELCFNLK